MIIHSKDWKNVNGIIIFFTALLVLSVWHISITTKNTVGDLSSDVWLVQYYEIQARENVWDYVPPSYNKERFYLAYPLLYYQNPGLEVGVMSYRLSSLGILIISYIITGLIILKITRSWLLAACAATLFVIPHTIFPTQIGMISLRNMRGLGFSFPFYALLVYYWSVYGIHARWQNITLGVVAAVSVYVYPPFGILIVPFVIISALMLYRLKYWRQILVFFMVYITLSSPFLYGHFTNSASGMLDMESNLTADELRLQADIVRYRIPDVSLAGMDWGVIKRSVWDGFPLLLVLIIGLFLWRRTRSSLSEDQRRAYIIGLYFLGVLLGFIFCVEFVNWILTSMGRPPFFIEHWRLMRVAGFVLLIQAVMVVYQFIWTLGQKKTGVAVLLVLMLTPLAISAPIVRDLVRSLVPESTRTRYNLAPVVLVSDVRDFRNLQDVAHWSRKNLPEGKTKIFVFAEEQEDFIFKVMSRHETNLTSKEGSMWITSGFENSKKWYEERVAYDSFVKNTDNFTDIFHFAKSINSTHILIPRGHWGRLYEEWSTKLPVAYINADYELIRVND